jgi:hypothetical protein
MSIIIKKNYYLSYLANRVAAESADYAATTGDQEGDGNWGPDKDQRGEEDRRELRDLMAKEFEVSIFRNSNLIKYLS